MITTITQLRQAALSVPPLSHADSLILFLMVLSHMLAALCQSHTALSLHSLPLLSHAFSAAAALLAESDVDDATESEADESDSSSAPGEGALGEGALAAGALEAQLAAAVAAEDYIAVSACLSTCVSVCVPAPVPACVSRCVVGCNGYLV